MRFSKYALPLFLLSLSGPAAAECIICDEVVQINSARAECFLENHSAIANAVAAAPDGRAPIDFDSCEVNGEKLSVRGSISDLPTPPVASTQPSSSTGSAPTKAVYLLDLAAIQCLKALIEKHAEPLDPLATFDLFEQCQP